MATGIDGVFPPEEWVASEVAAASWAASSPSQIGAFALAGDVHRGQGISEVVGRILGSGAAADERLAHLAGDPAACEAIMMSITFCHIMPAVSTIADPHERGRVANSQYGGRLCIPNGSKGLLVCNTPRWVVCVQLARHLARREDERDGAAHAARCRRHDAWAAAHAFETAGIALLLLRQTAAFLCGANLFEGMPPHCLVILTLDALRAHERVPARLRPQSGCAPERIVHPGWIAPAAEAATAVPPTVAVLTGGRAPEVRPEADGGDGDEAADSSSARSAARTAHARGSCSHELTTAVRGVLGREPQATLDEACESLDALGLEADRAEVKKALSKARREWARARGAGGGGRPTAECEAPPPHQREAMDDAVAGFDAEMAVWMRANGVSNPSAAEAARLRLLSDRLVEQRSTGDFDGAVSTWLETHLGSGINPTRLERKMAARKVRMFFDEAVRQHPAFLF